MMNIKESFYISVILGNVSKPLIKMTNPILIHHNFKYYFKISTSFYNFEMLSKYEKENKTEISYTVLLKILDTLNIHICMTESKYVR
jgi:hypothetical protein